MRPENPVFGDQILVLEQEFLIHQASNIRQKTVENSTIAQALSAHLGEGSSIFKLLSPTDAGGVKAQVAGVLEGILQEQQDQILREFSLDNKESALSRLVAELESSNGDLRTDLQNKVDSLAGEFSLDKPDSALSRLVGRVETAHKAISSEFSADNENAAIARLSRMLAYLYTLVGNWARGGQPCRRGERDVKPADGFGGNFKRGIFIDRAHH